MNGYAKRVDGNHKEVVEGLRASLPECTVFDASGAGRGFPDLVVGFKGRNWLFEVKNLNMVPSRRRLTAAQVGMHSNWQGQVAIIHSAADILAVMAREGSL
tara:strand:- start:3355 stop:3657 length:303 start_codon:yes stop_codon:yes gene_type:complete